MPCACSRWIVIAGALVAAGNLCLTPAVAAPTIWSGLGLSYTRSTDVDSALPQNQDRITNEVWLTRGASAGIFNFAVEDAYDKGIFQAPTGTLWATVLNNPNVVDLPENPNDGITAQNWANLTFEPWRTAYQGGSGGLPTHLLENRSVVKIEGALPATDDDIYFELQFTDWGVGGGPTFAYNRGVVTRTGDYNGDHLVNAADYTTWRNSLGQYTTMRGAAADGNASGQIDLGDYEFWKTHYGNEVLGSGTGLLSSSTVPEPTSAGLALLLVLMYSALHNGRVRLPPSRLDA